MKSTKLKNQHYSYLKMSLRILTLFIGVWALIVAYQAKDAAERVEKVQDNVIEGVLFKNK
jgi:hypothetical protein